MSTGDPRESLVPATSAALVRAGAATLAKRGLNDLQLVESADQLLKKAEECFSGAVNRLAPYLKDFRYQEGIEDEEHCALMREHFLYLQRAVALAPNYPKALYELANAFLKGFGVEKDGAEGLRLLCRAGDFASADELWKMSFDIAEGVREGELRPEDMKVAERFCRKSAEEGHAGGQYNLAALYAKGGLFAEGDSGLPRDRALALYWLRKAAGNGEFPPAENEIQHLWKRVRRKRK
ncbi:MAG: hypothetical protein ABSB50_03200 [Terracidiphilus sp.]|jgi:TPR repeat protein